MSIMYKSRGGTGKTATKLNEMNDRIIELEDYCRARDQQNIAIERVIQLMWTDIRNTDYGEMGLHNLDVDLEEVRIVMNEKFKVHAEEIKVALARPAPLRGRPAHQ